MVDCISTHLSIKERGLSYRNIVDETLHMENTGTGSNIYNVLQQFRLLFDSCCIIKLDLDYRRANSVSLERCWQRNLLVAWKNYDQVDFQSVKIKQFSSIC